MQFYQLFIAFLLLSALLGLQVSFVDAALVPTSNVGVSFFSPTSKLEKYLLYKAIKVRTDYPGTKYMR